MANLKQTLLEESPEQLEYFGSDKIQANLSETLTVLMLGGLLLGWSLLEELPWQMKV